MLFKDEVIIQVQSGNGGNGSTSFHRAKFIPKGGPDGGDGGRGGDVVFRANPQMRTLSHFRRLQWFRAKHGEHGLGDTKYGKKGESIVIDVPPGTVIYDAETNELLYDLVEPEEEIVIAGGGNGGWGNVHYKSSVNQTPMYAQDGKPGIQKKIKLELKLIAHVGLVGFPNAGKSTLISRITQAKPKIANYPFTTLAPNLGVMTLDDASTQILIADIPGLIEGAHHGKGLGHKFLRHIERTRLLLFMLDLTADPKSEFDKLRDELKNYSQKLYERDFIIALNKKDMLDDIELEQHVIDEFKGIHADIMVISALNGQGLAELKVKIYQHYIEAEKAAQKEEQDADPAQT
jgi:GTP-binding protein